MGAGHSHGELAELTPAQQRAQSNALRILVGLLVPLAVLTLVGLVWLWPRGVDAHIRNDTGTVRVPGTTVQNGEVRAVRETSCQGEAGTFPGDDSVCATITVRLLDGPEQGQNQSFQINSAVYDSGVSPGTKVTMYRVPTEQGQAIYSFLDFTRSTPLAFFVIVFAALVVAVARLRGFLSLIGLGFAFFIMVKFMMPALIEGKDPLLVGIVGSAAIMFVVLYTSHGFTVRTTTALVGTLFGLGVAALLGVWATRWTHLTGVVDENDFMLTASAPDLKLTSVVVVSMIVAAMGALNDVTITQASSVWELARSEKRPLELYRSAMRIGRDHIASTVYTIAFAAAGAAMTSLLLIEVYNQNLGEMLVQEMFAGEILRTIIGSIGLVLAVPLTTGLGVMAVTAGRRLDAAGSQGREGGETWRGDSPTEGEEEAAPVAATRVTTTRPSRAAADRDLDDEPDVDPAPAARPRRGAARDHDAFRRPDHH